MARKLSVASQKASKVRLTHQSQERRWLNTADKEATALLLLGACLGDGDCDPFFQAMQRIRYAMEPLAERREVMLVRLSVLLGNEIPSTVGSEHTLEELVGLIVDARQSAAYYLGLSVGMRVSDRQKGTVAA